MAAHGTKTRRLVWTHKSGRKSLLLGHSASHIEGMDIQEGRALLCRLCEWATQPQYVYSHDWKMGDLLIWDNSGAMHRVVRYPLDSERMMHRTTLFGEEPVA
jgi:alpha-ketoglutarate-dependent taurine dioxygenase